MLMLCLFFYLKYSFWDNCNILVIWIKIIERCIYSKEMCGIIKIRESKGKID